MARHTIRKYQKREISDELLKQMLLEASHAPTTGNMQLYSVIITRDEEMKRKLAPAHFGQPQVESSSVTLTFCADFNRFVKWCKLRCAEPGYDNLQSFAAAAIDTIVFAQEFNNIAEANGLGCCYLGTTTYNPQEIASLLQLPKRVVPLVTITVGYPAEEGDDVGRLPVEAICHSETYHDYSEADIDKFYAEKEARADSVSFVKENGKQSLAQVFTDVRYPKGSNEAFSDKLFQFIKANYPGIINDDTEI